MFNVYLPKLLETRSPSRDPDGAPKSLEDSLWDVVIYSLGGCPGALVSLISMLSSYPVNVSDVLLSVGGVAY